MRQAKVIAELQMAAEGVERSPEKNLMIAVVEMALIDAVKVKSVYGGASKDRDKAETLQRSRDYWQKQALAWLTSDSHAEYSFRDILQHLCEDHEGIRLKILTEVYERRKTDNAKRNRSFSTHKVAA